MHLGPFLGLFLAVLLAGGQAAHSEPFAFRGIQLGTTLDDLRRIRFPEVPDARLLCSHDAEAADIRPTADYAAPENEADAGVIVCGYYTFAKALGPQSRVLPPEWLLARLNSGPIEAQALFWLVPEDAGQIEDTARLYRIALRANSTFWPQLRAAYVRRYGSPAETYVGVLQQPGKRDLPAETLTWRETASEIRLLQRDKIATRTTVVFEHAGLKPSGGASDTGAGPAVAPGQGGSAR